MRTHIDTLAHAFAIITNVKFAYEKLLRDYVKWVDRETGGNAGYTPRELDEVEGLLSKPPSDGVCLGLGQELSYLANWYARSGVVKIGRGDSQGWRELDRSRSYSFWNIRIRSRIYDRAENKRKVEDITASIVDSGHCGVLCFALNATADAEWMAQRLQQSRTDESIAPWSWPHTVPRLVIALQRYLGGQTSVGDLELGGYKAVFANWDRPEGLQRALLDAADYHVQHLEDRDGDDIAEFSRPPVDSFRRKSWRFSACVKSSDWKHPR